MVIVAAGLSPAWQQILVLDAFVPGTVIRAREAHWCGSGKVLNVGLTRGHVGADVRTVAPLGGQAREAIEREFANLEIPLAAIRCRRPTRVCTTLLDAAGTSATELVEEPKPLTEAELHEYVTVYTAEAQQAALIVLSGSLPPGVPPNFFHELMSRTRGRVVVDARGPALLAALPARPFVVKPNRQELARTVGRELASDGDLLAAMRELNTRGAEWVVITGGAAAVWVTSRERTYRIQPPAVRERVNPIGCGDALAAGLAWATERGHDAVQAVRYGMAAAADRLSKLLPGRINPARVETIAETITVEDVTGSV